MNLSLYALCMYAEPFIPICVLSDCLSATSSTHRDIFQARPRVAVQYSTLCHPTVKDLKLRDVLKGKGELK